MAGDGQRLNLVPITSGRLDSRIMIVGEAPGEDEAARKTCFTGLAGQELDRMLGEAMIAREECLLTNISDIRPPNNDIDHFFLTSTEGKRNGLTPINGLYPVVHLRNSIREVRSLIKRVSPNIVIALGDKPMWALTGERGITLRRGSEYKGLDQVKVIPTIHPAAILRLWNQRSTVVQDLRRARRESRDPLVREMTFATHIAPSVSFIVDILHTLQQRCQPIVCDLETRGGQIACIGLAWSKNEAMCIPFMCLEGDGSYYSILDEFTILKALIQCLTFCPVIFQNGLFDCQYIARQMGFIPNVADDTMIMQHTCWPGLPAKLKPKSLGFLSSYYCEHHRFWKDEGDMKLWEPGTPESQLWYYNCEDLVRTFECWEVLNSVIDKLGVREQYNFQMKMFYPILKMMLRGINIDTELKKATGEDLISRAKETLRVISTYLGHELNPSSNPQMKTLFLEDFAVKAVKKRPKKGKEGAITFDDKALKTIQKRSPLLRPLIERIIEWRSLRVFNSTFCQMPVGEDGRMRCSINIAGTSSFRFTTNTDAWGEGGNLQNLPEGREEEEE